MNQLVKAAVLKEVLDINDPIRVERFHRPGHHATSLYYRCGCHIRSGRGGSAFGDHSRGFSYGEPCPLHKLILEERRLEAL